MLKVQRRSLRSTVLLALCLLSTAGFFLVARKFSDKNSDDSDGAIRCGAVHTLCRPRTSSDNESGAEDEPASAWKASALAGCTCLRTAPTGARPERSACGGFADLRGRGQQVVSFSFFGDLKGAYFRGIHENAEVLDEFYSGWLMRVYYSDPDNKHLEDFCTLACRYHHLDLCRVDDVTGWGLGPAGDGLANRSGVSWRFLPLVDPTVARFVSRDLDSLLGQRESDAVQEWVLSGKTLHVMRDHPMHSVPILAGAWGALNRDDSAISGPTRERLVTGHSSGGAVRDDANWGEDQALLEKYVYQPSLNSNDVFAHDSYFCGQFESAAPFPSRRDLTTYPHFIGDRVLFRDIRHERRTKSNWLYYIRECPFECRPKEHPDWLWC